MSPSEDFPIASVNNQLWLWLISQDIFLAKKTTSYGNVIINLVDL